MKPRKLDQIDIKILIELQRNGRVTNQRLSEVVGLSPRPCLERVRRLEEAGLIAGYRAVIEMATLPDLVSAFTEISLKSQSSSALAAFEKYIWTCPEVVACYLVGGQFDYVAQVACPSLDRYNALTSDWLDNPALGIERIVSRFVMKPVRSFSGYPLELLAQGAKALQQN